MGKLTDNIALDQFESAVRCLDGSEAEGDVMILKALARMFGDDCAIGGDLAIIVTVAVDSIKDMERA